jgi:hypothetical protein
MLSQTLLMRQATIDDLVDDDRTRILILPRAVVVVRN